MNPTQLVAAIQYWDNFNIDLLMRVLEAKYKIDLKLK
jgi:hypothetical protein